MNSQQIKQSIIDVDAYQSQVKEDTFDMMCEVALGLKQMRNHCGLTIKDVSVLLGVTKQYLYGLEGCKFFMPPKIASKLLAIYENELRSKE